MTRWTRYDDERLLDVRLCDLGLSIEGTELESLLAQLHDELGQKGLRLRPHAWLSSEWFSPDGIPGVAIPFYLAHPRLKRLEKRFMLEVEGGSRAECLKLLRHEAGHAFSTAYRLHYKPSWRKAFGHAGSRYPESYVPRPFSRNFVVHLGWWYAQAHPAEDFAETFAVWLNPQSRWRSQYRSWPALKKLEYVDELMTSLQGETPKVRSRRQVEPLKEARQTLREHYHDRRRRYAEESPDFYDRDLTRLFSSEKQYARRPGAASFLRERRVEIRERVARWTGAHEYTIDIVLRDMISRCRRLGLRVRTNDRDATLDAFLMVAVQIMYNLNRGKYRITI